MKSCNKSKMTQKTILLGAAILITYSFGKSEGFFLNNRLETTTSDNPISTTFSPDTSITDNNQLRFDVIHRNVSEKFEESSTQIVNSVKDIVSLVLDDHSADYQIQENNKSEVVTDSDNDIPSAEALVTNLKLDSDDPPLSIVQIPESDSKDVATALEDSIRSSVKDEIQLEQNFESSAIDNIPDPDVRQTLTEELMAIDYPQGIKKSDENSEESKKVVANEDDKIQLEPALKVLPKEIVGHTSQVPNTTVSPMATPSTATPVISTTTVATTISTATTTPIPTTTSISTTTPIPTKTLVSEDGISDIIDTTDLIKAIPEVETLDVNVTTPTIEIFQEITLIPSEEIVHDVVEPQDTLEANPTLTRQMRGFNEQSETNEISSESLDSTEKEESSENNSDSSNSSKNSSVSSDSSSKESSVIDENVAAEESENADAVISQEASIEDDFGKGTTTAAEIIPSKRVTPTPRPAILSTIEATVEPIEIDGITESSGELLTEATITSGDGNHIVMKKPGVEEEIYWSNSTGKSILETAEAPSDNATAKENPIKLTVAARADVDPTVNYVKNVADTQVLSEVTETSITADISPIVQTIHEEKHLLKADSEVKPIDLDPLSAGTPLENVPRTLKESLDNKTEQAAKNVTYVDHKSIQTDIPNVHDNNTVKGDELVVPLIDQEKQKGIVEFKLNHTSDLRTLNVEPATIWQVSLHTNEENLDQTTTADELLKPQSILPGQQIDTDDRISAAIVPPQLETELQTNSIIEDSTPEITSTILPSGPQISLDAEDVQTSSVETSTEIPTILIEEQFFPLKEAKTNADIDATSKTNEISKHIEEAVVNLPSTPKSHGEEPESITYESSTEKPIGRSSANDNPTTPALVKTLIEAAELTTEFARHVDSFRSTREETSAISDEIVSPASAGRSFNTIIAEGLGKPLPTRSVGDEPSTSSYSSEDKTTTVVVLCSAAALIFVSFSIAMYLITFQRQHGTLDIEMQEQRCGKDDLEDDDDAETRVTLLNQNPPVDSDEHSFD